MKRRHAIPTILMLAFAAGVSLLPGGAGNVGRTGDTAGGGGTVEMTQAGEFTVNTTPGQSMTSIRDALVAQINASPMMYVAAALANDPNDPDDATSLTVTRMGGVEANHLKICTNDPGINHAGIGFVGGKSFAILKRVTSVAGDGFYHIWVDTTLTDVDANIPTSVAPNNTPAGLNASICSALTGSGITCDLGTYGAILLSRPGGQILGVRVTATDSAIQEICVDLTNDLATGSIPTLSQYGMFILVLLMTGAAIIVMRRKAASSH